MGVKLHHCNQPGCHELIPFNERYCRLHKEDRAVSNKFYNEFRRDKQANKFYHSPRWTKVRNYVVARDMYLSAVSDVVIKDKDIIVDHIIPRRLLSEEQQYNADNLWLLSRREHNIKTKLEQSMNDRQLKHLSRSWWIKVIKEKLDERTGSI